MPQIRKILSPVDFSETSLFALDYAMDLAKQLGAELHLVHTYQLPVYALPDGALMASPEYVNELSAKLQDELDKLVASRRAEGVVLRGHLSEGVPHSEICRQAKDLGVDLIIMGTHGRSGFGHLLLGSVTEKVVRSSEIPVLTVRHPEG